MSLPLRVLVLGVQPRGVGVLIAHELLAAGVEKVTVADADGVVPEEIVKELGEVAMKGALLVEPFVPGSFSSFDVVVCTDTAQHELVRHSEACHAAGKIFCVADVFGLLGFVFLDAGAREDDGVPGVQGSEVAVERLTEDGWVEVDSDARSLCLAIGDEVIFTALRGPNMDRANNRMLPVLEVKTASRFRVDATSLAKRGVDFGQHRSGTGVVGKVNQLSSGGWMTLRQALVRPSPDSGRSTIRLPVAAEAEHGPAARSIGKPGRSALLHVACQGVCAFRQRHGYLPALDSQEHAGEVRHFAARYVGNQRMVNKTKPSSALTLPGDDEPDARLTACVAQYARGVHTDVRDIVVRIAVQELTKPKGVRGSFYHGGSTEDSKSSISSNQGRKNALLLKHDRCFQSLRVESLSPHMCAPASNVVPQIFQPSEQCLYVDALGALPETKEEELPPARDVLERGLLNEEIANRLQPYRHYLES